MSTTIRVSEETKALLERLKGDEETFDELLERLAQQGGEMNPGVWDEEQAEAAREIVRRSRESFERDG